MLLPRKCLGGKKLPETKLESELSTTPMTLKDVARGWQFLVGTIVIAVAIGGGIVRQYVWENSSEARMDSLESAVKQLTSARSDDLKSRDDDRQIIQSELSNDRLVIQKLMDTVNYLLEREKLPPLREEEREHTRPNSLFSFPKEARDEAKQIEQSDW